MSHAPTARSTTLAAVLCLVLALLTTIAGAPDALAQDTAAQDTAGADVRRRVGLLCALSDNPDRPYGTTDVQRLYDDPAAGAEAYIEENAYGSILIEGSTAHGWYDLPGATADYFQLHEDTTDEYFIAEYVTLAQDCIDAASGDPDVDWARVDGVDVWFNLDGGIGGIGGVEILTRPTGTGPTPVSWMPDPSLTQVFTHELGHTFGGPHSGGPIIGPDEEPRGSFDGSHWDGLAGTSCRHQVDGFGCLAPHYIADTKRTMGFLPEDRIVEPVWGDDVDLTLERLARPGPDGALLVALTTPTGCLEYSLEARRHVGFDQAVPFEGVVIHRIDRNDVLGTPARVVLNADEPDPDINQYGRINPNSTAGAWTVGERLTTPEGLIVEVTAETPTGYDVSIRFDDTAQDSVFTVSSSADAGPGTLRAAIEAVNELGCVTTTPRIEFTNTTPATIALETPLDPIIAPVEIVGNGTVIDGSAARIEHGLHATSGELIVSDLTISGFSGSGLRTEGARLDATNVTVTGNANGIDVVEGGGHVIRDVVVTGSSNIGVTLFGVDGAVVTGSQIQDNGFQGLNVAFSADVEVGGDGPADRNVLIGHTFAEIVVDRSAATIVGNTISGAYKGVEVLPSADAPGDVVTISRNDIDAPLAIDVGGDDLTANDPGDADEVLNHPTLVSVSDGDVVGSLDVGAGLHRVELFASDGCAASGSGPLGRYLDGVDVRVADGPADFSAALPHLAAGEVLSATTVGPDGRTSEASPCLTVEHGFPGDGPVVEFAVTQSQRRFPSVERGAGPLVPYAVLARSDEFADALSASVLTGQAPLLFSERDALPSVTLDELDRLMPGGGPIYVMGGEAAISADVIGRLTNAGHQPRRLQGPTRVETSIATFHEASSQFGPPATVMLARANAPADNPTAAWADSVSAGGWAARSRTPILLTQSEGLHPAVDVALREEGITSAVLLGGEAALSPAVAEAVAGPVRAAGPNRFATAAVIATTVWGGASGRFVIAPGAGSDGWAYALVGAGLSADTASPVLLVEPSRLPSETSALLDCGSGADRVGDVLGTINHIDQRVRDLLAAC